MKVTVTGNSTPEKRISKITRETYNLTRRIRLAFAYMDEEMTMIMIISLIRPTREYAAILWSPYKKKDISKLESEQQYQGLDI